MKNPKLFKELFIHDKTKFNISKVSAIFELVGVFQYDTLACYGFCQWLFQVVLQSFTENIGNAVQGEHSFWEGL